MGSITMNSTELIKLTPGIQVFPSVTVISFQSDIIPIRLYHGHGCSNFARSVTRRVGRLRLSGAYWHPGETDLELLSGNEEIQIML